MSKHIHIYLPTRTRDDIKHAPAGSATGGQFVAGSGGGGGSSAKKTGAGLTPKGNSSDPKERSAHLANLSKGPAKAPSHQPGYKGGQGKPMSPADSKRLKELEESFDEVQKHAIWVGKVKGGPGKQSLEDMDALSQQIEELKAKYK